MNWFAITLLEYFLLGLEIVLDKFLLSSKRVSHPAIYAFYPGTLGMFALVFITFGFHMVVFLKAVFMIFSGMIFIYGMMALFFAVSKSEASRVAPVIGAIIPVTVFFLSMIFLGERLNGRELSGILFLIFGGIFISFDFSKKDERKIFRGFRWSILAGILLAISAAAFKNFYQQDNFIKVYIWTRIGAFLGAMSFFLVPKWRNIIFSSLLKFKNPQKENQRSGTLYIISRSTGGLGSILKEKATSFASASVTLVNAMVSIEYVFIFFLSIIFSFWFPSFFKEKKDIKTVIQKIISILIITAGVTLILS